MDKARFLIETHLRTGKPLGELAAAHGVHRSWLYKLLARYRVEGEAGLEARSRRPHRSPTRISSPWEERIVTMRKELVDLGADAGAETIRYHLAKVHEEVPSVSTIWRVLKARGFVTAQPQKRPKSSWHRFAYEFPNECWQADVTHVAGGRRNGLRGPEHDRRPLTDLCGVEGVRDGDRPRRGAQPPQGSQQLGLSGIASHRQRVGLHVPGPPRDPRAPRDDPRVARHRLEALASLPPPDLREGRALPSDAEEVPRETGARRRRRSNCKSNSTASSRTTTRSVRTGPSAGAPRSRHSKRASGASRATLRSTAVATRSEATRSTSTAR